MATKNYWTRLVPPGFNKNHMIPQNPSAVQGGPALQSFYYLPTGGDKLPKCKQIFDFNFVNDQYYQPLQVEADGTNRVILYKYTASFTTNHIGGSQSPVIRIDQADFATPPAQTLEAPGTIMPQFDMLCDKVAFSGYVPTIPGKTETYAIKVKPVSPYNNQFYLTNENISGSNGEIYTVVGAAPVEISGGNYVGAGVNNLYKSNTDTSTKIVTSVFDGIAGPYTLWSSVYNGNPVYPPDRMKKDTTGNIFPSLLNNVYIKSSDISGSNQWQGAWQIKKSGQGFSNPYDDNYYCDWFSDVDTDTFKDVGLVETRKFFGQRVCNPLRVKEVVSETINTGSYADPFNGERYYVISPRLDYRESSVFGRHPICKKITADDIDSGSNMGFLIGKWAVWIGSQPEPIIVSENPLESGWEETPTEASYSKFQSNLRFRATTADGGAFNNSIRDFINITNTDNISGGMSNHICYNAGGSYYSRGFAGGQPEVNPDYDGIDDGPSENQYLWNTPWQVKSSANDTFRSGCAIGNLSRDITFHCVTYKLYNGGSDPIADNNYAYPTNVEMGWYKMAYNPSVGAFEPQGNINYVSMPIVATADTDDGLLGKWRLHKLVLTPSYFGATNPMESLDIRYFFRRTHPNPDIGKEVFSFTGGTGLNPFILDNIGSLPWTYPIPAFKPENALKLETYNQEDTALKGYYKPSYIWDYEDKGDFKDFMVSNGESLGNLTTSGSISGGNFEFDISGVRRYYYPNSPFICDETYNQSQSKSQHFIRIIRQKDGMSFAGLPPYNNGNAFWRFDDFNISGETSPSNTWQDTRNKNYYFETQWTNRKIFDQRKDSNIFIVLLVQIPLILNFPRNMEFFNKTIVLRKWKVELDGTTTEVYNIDTDGIE